MFAAIWEYEVKAGYEDSFVRVYGPDGEWVRLFRLAKGYLGTELWTDIKQKRRYVTIDRWESEKDWETFRSEMAADYAALDDRCEVWTESERRLGAFLLER